ncbi:hypothetical protein [Roseateles cavernae]|uniref:hypothetical protein n=1 Tax=Roseateles cavernae TaxID=3153578 RepID=UPI0032E3B6D1
MKIIPTLTLLISLASAGAVMAQPAAPAAKPANPQAGKKAPAKPRGKPVAKPVPPPPPLADATEEQLAATERAYLGTYDCEFKQSVSITRNIKPGYLDVMWQKDTFTMKPVLSSTGALRLEDVTGRTLMIQIANKSMLMDTHVGRRLVDECLHPEHRAAIEAAKIARAAAAASAAASGLEVEADASSLGIAPSPAKRGS